MLQNDPKGRETAPGKQSAFAASVRRFLHAIGSNPQFKLVALAIAIFIWGIQTFSNNELMVEKVLSGVEVLIVGQDQFRSRGYTISDDLSTTAPTVDIRVNVPWRNFASVTGTMFAPRIDLSRLRSIAGEQELPFAYTAMDEYGQVLEIVPSKITLNVEELKNGSRIPVSVVVRGEPSEDLWYSAPAANPQFIVVSGPPSLVDQARRGEVEISAADFSESKPLYKTSAAITLKDQDGNTVSSPFLRITNDSLQIRDVEVTCEVLPKKTVPIDTSTAVTGVPLPGYELAGLTVTPSSVDVVGPRSLLDTYNTIKLRDPIDISAARGGVMGISKMVDIPNLQYIGASGDVFIRGLLEPKISDRTFASLPIEPRNLNAALTARLDTPSMSVTISGDYFDIEALGADQAFLYVDLQGLAEGVHIVDVKCQANNVRSFSYLPQQAQVRVIINKTE